MTNDILALIQRATGRPQVGKVPALARLLSLLEAGDTAVSRQILSGLPHAHRAHVVGITGPPGAGKSTLTNAIAKLLRLKGASVAIVAVDPSSPFSGGALLGDRVRFQEHSRDPGVFFRSMSSRGQLGGLAPAVVGAIVACEAAGFNKVIVETVGVGQSEVDIAAVADTTIVALAPGMGDGVQAEKAGVLEIADIFVVNKADRPGAGQLAGELNRMLALGSHSHDVEVQKWRVPVLRATAVKDEGIQELVDGIDSHWELIKGDSSHSTSRRSFLIREICTSLVSDSLRAMEGNSQPWSEDPFAAVRAALGLALEKLDATGDPSTSRSLEATG